MKNIPAHVREVSAEDMAQEAADLLCTWIEEALTKRPRCLLALSGGTTPRPAYERLAQKRIDWEKVDIVLVDERCTDAGSRDSNQNMIAGIFPKARTFAPDTSLAPLEAADAYEKILQHVIGDRMMDGVVLGMGEDGHIASLFPPVTDEGLTRMGIVHTTTDRFAVRDRISMSLPLLQRSNHRLLLLSGEPKKKTWADMLASAPNPKRWPLHALMDATLTTILC